jgi:ABC-type phosphate transport system ATPase subunit
MPYLLRLYYPLFKITNYLFMNFDRNKTQPMPPCYEVALEDKANVINCLFQKEFIVALIGMGGIGKTTLSKKMYHLFHNQYDKM